LSYGAARGNPPSPTASGGRSRTLRVLIPFNQSKSKWTKVRFLFELVTVIGSDLFDLDDDIKQYLQDPTLPLIFKIKIGLRYYVTADIILQLNVFQDYLEKINPFLFLDVFGKQRKDRKIC